MKTLLLIFSLFLTSLNVAAYEIQVSGGVTQYTKQSDGFWYQEGFSHTIKQTTPAGSIGLYTSPTKEGWQYGLTYSHLGHITSEALAVASDRNYNLETRGCNGPCWPLSHWYGSGYVHGISLTAKKTFTSGVYLEGGLFIAKPHWSMSVPDWRYCSGAQIDTCSSPDMGPTAIHVEHFSKVQYSPTLKIGYNVNKTLDISLSIKQTSAKGDTVPGIYKAVSPTLQIGIRF